jgi:hypothetical protein
MGGILVSPRQGLGKVFSLRAILRKVKCPTGLEFKKIKNNHPATTKKCYKEVFKVSANNKSLVFLKSVYHFIEFW